MTAILTAFGSLAMLAFAAIIAVLIADWLASRIVRFDDGPAPRTIHPLWAPALALLVGIALVLRHVTPLQCALIALVMIPLIVAWYVDAKTGIVPDWCTLVPLALVAIVVVRTGHWVSLYSAIVIFIPFGIAALLSRGRGMGWGDVKLATLCATLIGMMAALPAFAAACLAATTVAYRRDRGATPIAFGPYLVVATLLALAVTVTPS
jgi:prepilin signal peptidase PulO-like enzyme (type II secretory pathway)